MEHAIDRCLALFPKTAVPRWVSMAFTDATFGTYQKFYDHLVKSVEDELAEKRERYNTAYRCDIWDTKSMKKLYREEMLLKQVKASPARLSSVQCEAVWSVLLYCVIMKDDIGMNFCKRLLRNHAKVLGGCSVSEHKLTLVLLIGAPENPELFHDLCEKCSGGKVSVDTILEELTSRYLYAPHLFGADCLGWTMVFNAISFVLEWRRRITQAPLPKRCREELLKDISDSDAATSMNGVREFAQLIANYAVLTR